MNSMNLYQNTLKTDDGKIELVVAENMCNSFVYSEFLLTHLNEIHGILNKEIRYILDVGCGAGPFSIYYAKKDKKVTAIDINPIALECCKENVLNHNLNQLVEIKNIGIDKFESDQRYDLIICNPPYGNESYMRKNISDNIKTIQNKMEKKIYDAEVDDFLTNCWQDDLGKDMVDYIFEKADKLLNHNGKILIICGNDFIDGKKYMIEKINSYKWIKCIFENTFKEKLSITDGREMYDCEKEYNILVFERC